MVPDDFESTERPNPEGDPQSSESSQEARTRRVLTGISSRSWEHPADRAALHALRTIPIFDEVLKKLFGFFGEKPIRLAFQANSVQVSHRQFGRVHGLYQEVLRTLDAPEAYPLFISQTPMVNAGAYGMERPFVLLNSGAVSLLDDDELQYVLAHEVGHILSGHVLYRTMLIILIQLAERGFPIVGLAARGVLVALLEWYRKSELSADRAGLLGVQEPRVVYRAMLKMAGGGRPDEMNVSAFLEQAEAYRDSEDMADSVFKVLNLLGATHPFYVLRVSELREWIESGQYDRILAGEYRRRDEPEPSYAEDLGDAASSYQREAREFVDDLASAARKMRDSLLENLRSGGSRTGGNW
ncbi:MAG: M48 family peptidase [Gemmatimonadales bacterium]|nr:MAG: M48 family peptidase [Gemmatimonadales bacterium]